MTKSSFTFLLILLWGSFPAYPHAGEDHGESGARPPATDQSGIVAEETASELVEVLLKHEPLVVGKKASLTLFIAQADDNLPLGAATIELEISGVRDFKIRFTAADDAPGVYHAHAIFPASGHYSAIVSVAALTVHDILVLNGLTVKDVIAVHGSGKWLWVFVLAGILIFAIVLLLIRVNRIRGTRRSPSLKPPT